MVLGNFTLYLKHLPASKFHGDYAFIEYLSDCRI